MNNDRLKALFEAHPGQDTVHLTSDGMPFFNRMAAATHAGSRKDRVITTVQRHEVFAPEKVAEQVPELTPEQIALAEQGEHPHEFGSADAEDNNTGTTAADATDTTEDTKVDEIAADATDPGTGSADADATEGSEITNPIEGMTNAQVTAWTATVTDPAVLESTLKYATTKGGSEAIQKRINQLTPAE